MFQGFAGPVFIGLFVLCWILMVFIPRNLRISYSVVLLAKLLLLITSCILVRGLPGHIFPGYPDQNFYLGTAQQIAESVKINGLHVDYQSIVIINNRLYNIILGWLAFFNQSANPALFRMFNIVCSLIILIFCLKITRSVYGLSSIHKFFTVWGIGLLPTLNIYSMLALRDVFICMLVTMFFYFLLKRNYLMLLVVFILTYYTRTQLVLIFGAISLFLILSPLESNRQITKKQIMHTFMAASLLIVIAVYKFSGDVHVRKYLAMLYTLPNFALSFPISILGLDFLMGNADKLSFSRINLLLIRFITPETIVLPMLAFYMVLRNKTYGIYYRCMVIGWWLFTAILAYGYFVEYGSIFVRILVPLYPVAFVISLPLLIKSYRKLTEGLSWANIDRKKLENVELSGNTTGVL